MHLYCLTRGIKHEVDRFINELSAKYLEYEYAKGQKGLLQFSVRPVQLWEFVFPEQHYDTIMTTFKPLLWNRMQGSFGMMALRKALDVEKIPEVKSEANIMPLYIPKPDGIEMFPIGIKHDLKFDASTPDREGTEKI